MARKQEPDIEFDPRHRIVGAIILVTLAVILFPLMLDERSPSANALTAEIDNAERPESTLKTVIKTVSIRKSAETNKDKTSRPGQSKPGSEKIVATTGTDQESKVIIKKVTLEKKKPSDNSESAKSVKSVESKKESKKVILAKQTKAAPKPKPVLKPHWAVQVGTFSNPGNVRRLDKQLKERGYSVMLKDVNLKQGSAVRVRVGPYRTRGSADRAQGKINREIGVKGVVVAGP